MGNETVIVLAVDLEDCRTLGVETSVDGEGSEQSSGCEAGEDCRVDHFVGGRWLCLFW